MGLAQEAAAPMLAAIVNSTALSFRASAAAKRPPGWGFYLRQRLQQDEATPLAIRDEPGGVTLYRDRR